MIMNDTSPDVKRIQLEIWLSKPPMERLRLTLEDNDALFALWDSLKKQYEDSSVKDFQAKSK
jgi:hypothetical protein